MVQRLLRSLVGIAAASAALVVSTPAAAEFTFVVPQKPGGGTSVWATTVAAELEKKLGEPIRVLHLPGARDRIGFEKFHSEMRDDPYAVMVSHGGNAVSFLQEKVSYDYAQYDAVALMSSNIIVSARTSFDPAKDKVIFAEQSGTVPEALALAMLHGWDNMVYVKGMSSAENRLAFRRGEVNVTRENPAAHREFVADMIAAGDARVYFHHGLFNGTEFAPDPNFPDAPTFEQLYRKVHGKDPREHELYGAYAMVKAWRDGVQKALWVHRGNPNLERLRTAVRAMLDDPEALARLHERLGNYPWRVGEDAEAYVASLYSLITEPNLKSLVAFNRDKLKIDSYYNPDRVKHAVATGSPTSE
jgi:putative tricarboxylic transport membrane protein